MEAAKIQEGFRVRLAPEPAGRGGRSPFRRGGIDPVGNHADRAGESVGADGLFFGGIESMETSGSMDIGVFEKRGGEVFFPRGIPESPCIEHAVWRNDALFSGAAGKAEAGGGRVHPEAMQMHEIEIRFL